MATWTPVRRSGIGPRHSPYSLSWCVMVASPRGPQPSVASVDMYVGLAADQIQTEPDSLIFGKKGSK